MIQAGGYQREVDAERIMTPQQRRALAHFKIHEAMRRIGTATALRDEHTAEHGATIACKYEKERTAWVKHLSALRIYRDSIPNV